MALDPDYALPYSGLADALLILSYASIGVIPPREAFPRAMETVRRALELDNTLAEAHTSLAFAYLAYVWDWIKTEEEFKKAIALNPRYALAHIWYAMFLTQQERHQEATDHARTAQLLEPFSPLVHSIAGLLAYVRRENDETIEHVQKGLALMPNFSLLHIYLGYAYDGKQMYKKAAETLQRARVLSGDSTYALAVHGTLAAQMGDLATAQTALQILLQRREEGYVLPCWIAGLYMELNERDKALEWYDLALKERDSILTWFRMFPRLVRFTSDKEIAAILDKVVPEI